MLIDLYDRLVLKRPAAALIAAIAVVLLFCTKLPDFKLDASADALVLENDSDLRYYRRTITHYGARDDLIITYAPHDDLFSQIALEGLRRLRADLSNLPGAESVTTILDVPLLFSPTVALSGKGEKVRTLETPGTDFDLAQKEFRENPLYRGRLVSADGRTTAILVTLPVDRENERLLLKRTELREKKFTASLTPEEAAELDAVSEAYRKSATALMARQEKVVAAIREIMDRHREGATLFLGGVPMIVADMIAYIENDLVVFGFGVVLFIVITLWLIFRRPRWVLLPLLSCVAAVLVMMGFLGLMDWRVTVISSNFISLMVIITISITIHLIVRYRELCSLHASWDQRTLVRETVRLKAVPCLYTTFTTIAAFSSLLVSAIRPVMDFGMMMSLGLLASLALSFILLPAGAMLLGREVGVRQKAPAHPLTLHLARFTEVHGGKVLAVSILLAVLSGIGMSKLVVENRFIDYFRQSTEIYRGLAIIDRELGGTTPLDLVIDLAAEAALPAYEDEDDDLFGVTEDPASPKYWFKSYRLERIEKVHEFLESLPETGPVLSIATLMKVVTKLNDGILLDDFELAILYDRIPEEVRALLVKPYVSFTRNQIRIAMRVRESDKNLAREALLAKIRTFLTEEMDFPEDKINLTNMLVLYNNMLQSLFRSQILTIGVVFFGILIMFLVLFRSLRLAAIAIVPNLLPAMMVLGTMGWLGIPLDMMTITIAAITIGIAVDDTIHYIHRFRKEFAKDSDYIAAVYRCHGSIGMAMYYTSLTIVIGFSILSASNFIPTVYFGLFTGMAMLAALLAALTLLPQLIITFKPFGPEASPSIHT